MDSQSKVPVSQFLVDNTLKMTLPLVASLVKILNKVPFGVQTGPKVGLTLSYRENTLFLCI